jgi:hypothetical protein
MSVGEILKAKGANVETIESDATAPRPSSVCGTRGSEHSLSRTTVTASKVSSPNGTS